MSHWRLTLSKISELSTVIPTLKRPYGKFAIVHDITAKCHLLVKNKNRSVGSIFPQYFIKCFEMKNYLQLL